MCAGGASCGRRGGGICGSSRSRRGGDERFAIAREDVGVSRGQLAGVGDGVLGVDCGELTEEGEDLAGGSCFSRHGGGLRRGQEV